MADEAYFLEGQIVHKRAIAEKLPDGGKRYTVGFPVCEVSEWTHPEQVLAIFNASAEWGSKERKQRKNEGAEFLQWVHDRMVEVHGENKNYDYMHRFREIIKEYRGESDGVQDELV